jgi:hypothetical protein
VRLHSPHGPRDAPGRRGGNGAGEEGDDGGGAGAVQAVMHDDGGTATAPGGRLAMVVAAMPRIELGFKVSGVGFITVALEEVVGGGPSVGWW